MSVSRPPSAGNIHLSNKIVTSFSTASATASSTKKVTTSLLVNLIKRVKNSPEELNLSDVKNIESSAEKLAITLRAQNSNRYNDKYSYISEAVSLARSKSQPWMIEQHKLSYKDLLDNVKLATAALIKKSGYLMSRVNELTKEFSSKMQKAALDFIATGSHSCFQYDSPETRMFFPVVDVPQEPGLGTSKPESQIGVSTLPVSSSNSNLLNWTSLELLSRNQKHVGVMLELAITLINKEDSFRYPPRNAQAERELALWKNELAHVAEHYDDNVESIQGATNTLNLSDINSGILNLSGVTTSDTES